jgi:hypothetical protein
MQQHQVKPSFFPEMDMTDIPTRETEQKDVAREQDASTLYEYIEWREASPNTGFLKWRNEGEFDQTIAWLQEQLPLIVPTRVLVRPDGATEVPTVVPEHIRTCVGALTRYEDLKAGPVVTITEIGSYKSGMDDEAFIEFMTADYLARHDEYKNAGNLTDGYWKTMSVVIDSRLAPNNDQAMDVDEMSNEEYHTWVADVPRLATNVLPGFLNRNALFFSDLIDAALRKRKAAVHEQMYAMILAETRRVDRPDKPATALGRAVQSGMFDKNLYGCVASMLV